MLAHRDPMQTKLRFGHRDFLAAKAQVLGGLHHDYRLEREVAVA